MTEITNREALERRLSPLFQATWKRVQGDGQEDARAWYGEAKLFKAALRDPATNFGELGEKVNMTPSEVRHALRRRRLDSPGRRKVLEQRVGDEARLLYEFLTGAPVTPEVYGRLRRTAFDSRQPYILPGLILREMVEKGPQELPAQLCELIPLLGWSYSRSLMRSLLDIFGEERGLKDKKERSSSSEGERVLELEQRVVDLTSSLEVTQQQLEAIEAEIGVIRKTAVADAAADFLRQMNAPRWGGLLDQLFAAENRVTVLRDTGGIPQELESVAATVRMVMRFFRKAGLRQQASPGAVLELDAEGAEQYIYEGSEYCQGAVKTVSVTAPGWIYRGQEVSRPSVAEVDCFTDAMDYACDEGFEKRKEDAGDDSQSDEA